MSDTATAAKTRFPPSIKFLAWNEAAERFSYYGMTSILTLYVARHLQVPENQSIALFQFFTFAAYFMPIVGAWLADRFLGRYHTVLWLSFGYVAGHAVLAFWESAVGLAVGLALIAVGAGGIKPNASAFAGDQIPPGEQGLLAKLYDLYYWMINLGSTLGTLLIPFLYDRYGPRVAFGIPGVAMALALVVFVAGRRRYQRTGRPVRGSAARAAAAAEGEPAWRAVLRIVAVFGPVIAFWALFFQYGSSWTLQAEKMYRPVVPGIDQPLAAGQMQTLDALFVLALIPVFALWVAPALERRGVRVTPLRKMTVGMFVMVLSFVAAALVQRELVAGHVVHVAWQIPQYLFLALGEVLVSVTALEFAYSQAPARLKSVVMGLWFVSIACGSLLTAAVAWLNPFDGLSVAYYAFFAALMLVAAVAFAAVARWFPEREVPPAASSAAA